MLRLMKVLLQEGHSRSVYGINFHPDGSLVVATSSLDVLALFGTLRIAKSILALEGHHKKISASTQFFS